MKDYHFFATVSRMKYINRWALMRNARFENLSEHSLEVAMITHVLCTLANVRHGKQLNSDKAALLAIYHDASEIITGDLPTPVKYFSKDIKTAYKDVEKVAVERLLDQLPEDLKPIYNDILLKQEDTEELWKYVKAADKLSGLIKCIEEEAAGNSEFKSAYVSTRQTLEEMSKDIVEIKDFMEEFLPSYGKTLDELLEK